MNKVTSKDGTSIAFDRLGEGPAVILVTGALGVRAPSGHQQLADLLAPNFTVINYDRRGRGDSSDTLPYAVEREIEDLEALIDDAGGAAFVYGISSGAALALEAANHLPTKIQKLALYEPPFIIDDNRAPLPDDYVPRLYKFLAENRRGDAIELFMTAAINLPEEYLGPMRSSPMWAEMEKVAHTLPYDGTVMGDRMSGKPLPTTRWAAVTMPTLVMHGGESEPFFGNTARTLADLLPDAEHHIVVGQDHNIAPKALAPVLVEFFQA